MNAPGERIRRGHEGLSALLWLPALCGLLLGACGHAPEARNSRHTQAVEASQRAQAAYQRGEYSRAIKLYDLSLQLDRSIENADGIAVNLINLARVHRAMGQPDESHRHLDRLLDEKALQYNPAHLAAAAVQKALLRLDENQAGEANAWAEKASAHCAGDCKLEGVISNVRASIALHNNDADAAMYWGRQGIAGNKAGQQIEYANSLRLTAQADIMKKEFDTALVLLNEALAVDKALGLPEKIRLDLTQLANIHEAMGRPGLARAYRERAKYIDEVVDDKAGRK